MSKYRFVVLTILSIWALLPALAFGWNKHQALMPYILNSSDPILKQNLDRSISVQCSSSEKNRLANFAAELKLNPDARFPSFMLPNCDHGVSLAIRDLLKVAVDDPDQGMDRDLPADMSYDPKDERKWMGGSSSFASQGFRHMYFGGWKLSQPITTFQIPSYSVGQAPFRVETLARKSRALISSGDWAWGMRLMGWAIHYIQDLNQPFHSVQTVSMRMVPLSELFSWPPGHAVQEFSRQTARTITNFHWAYEGYTLERVLEGQNSQFATCLSLPENYSRLKFDPKNQTPLDLAFSVAHESIQLATALGSAEVELLGAQLLPRNADMTQNPNMIDFKNYTAPSNLVKVKEELDRVTCQALATTSLATRKLLEWTFQP